MTLPPGRARFSTSLPTGSIPPVITMGIVLVAFMAARSPAPPATMISTLRRTSRRKLKTDRPSPPHIGTRWRCSVLLCSHARAEPTEFPRNGWIHQRDSIFDRYPIRGTFFGCCASAIAPTASSTTAITTDDRPAFFIARSVLGVIYHADGNKEKDDHGRRRKVFFA